SETIGKEHSIKPFIKDLSWYFVASLVPLAIGFIKTPVFTRHFSGEDFGYLGIISTTFTYLGMFLFSWIASCIWRFYVKYKDQQALKTLFSNLMAIYALAVFFLTVISVSWYFSESHALIKQLILFSFFQLVFNQLFLMLMVFVRLEGQAGFYTVFQSLRAALGLISTIVLVFGFKANISALVAGLALIDFLALVLLLWINPMKLGLSIKSINRADLRILINYGSAGLVVNLAFLVISSSDRYIIALLSSMDKVGIYDQVYKISQLSVLALITVYFNTVNPYLIRELETNFKKSAVVMRQYLLYFLLAGIPVVFYMSLFARQIAGIFLGSVFREGYVFMPFIFLATLIQGVSNFFELRLKFSDRIKKLSLIVIAVAVLNVLITYLFVNMFGYIWAAYTTLVTYAFLVLVFYLQDRELFNFSRPFISLLAKVLMLLALQLVIYLIVKQYFGTELIPTVIMALVFVVSFVFIIKKQLPKFDA
ncbi:MAG: oligosaccharide flippase family protein, partial [Flavobacteriaceae bacterium]|nr:oligosaccharide flippase family protein [Flavobacteriaceae bacterium]